MTFHLALAARSGVRGPGMACIHVKGPAIYRETGESEVEKCVMLFFSGRSLRSGEPMGPTTRGDHRSPPLGAAGHGMTT